MQLGRGNNNQTISFQRKGKQVDGVTFGFIAFQGFAGMMLLGIFFQFLSAMITFRSGVDFLPVMITYTKSESYQSTDSDGDKVTRYNNYYYYEVDGKQYEDYDSGCGYSVSLGQQETRYYNPDAPHILSSYPNAKAMMGDTKLVWILFFVFEIPALIFLYFKRKKKKEQDEENAAYEAAIRRDMDKISALFDSLHMSMDINRINASLEPQRKQIHKDMKKKASLERTLAMGIGGNVLFLVVNLVKMGICGYQLKKVNDRLAGEQAAFYRDYKKQLVEPVLNNCFESHQYQASQGFSASELNSYSIFSDFCDKVDSEDYISGTYRDVSYRQADCHAFGRTTDNERKRIFQGRVSVYDFKKQLNSSVVVRTKGFQNTNIAGFERVTMENVEFNTRFVVFAQNPHMAFYLLTPQFMEYIMNLNKRGEMCIYFAKNHVYFMRSGISGVFEPDLKHPLDMKYEIGKSYQEMKEILDFIEILNLDKVAEQANNAQDSGILGAEWETAMAKEEEPKYGVVKDSIFDGPEFDLPPTTLSRENEFVEEDISFSDPDSSYTSKTGLKLKL